MNMAVCVALAVAVGVPADPRPSWREDFAPLHPQARPRPAEDAARSPFGERTGQVVLRKCLGRPDGHAILHSTGYRPVTVDMTEDGKFYERWTRRDGAWESALYDPVTGLFCPFLHGPAWGYFVPSDR